LNRRPRAYTLRGNPRILLQGLFAPSAGPPLRTGTKRGFIRSPRGELRSRCDRLRRGGARAPCSRRGRFCGQDPLAAYHGVGPCLDERLAAALSVGAKDFLGNCVVALDSRDRDSWTAFARSARATCKHADGDRLRHPATRRPGTPRRGAPFIQQPLEVASLLHDAGAPDHVSRRRSPRHDRKDQHELV
jgi:hypothetical protein